jgi:hypothetical protein
MTAQKKHGGWTVPEPDFDPTSAPTPEPSVAEGNLPKPEPVKEAPKEKKAAPK